MNNIICPHCGSSRPVVEVTYGGQKCHACGTPLPEAVVQEAAKLCRAEPEQDKLLAAVEERRNFRGTSAEPKRQAQFHVDTGGADLDISTRRTSPADEGTGSEEALTLVVRIVGLIVLIVAGTVFYMRAKSGAGVDLWQTCIFGLAVGGAYALVAGRPPATIFGGRARDEEEKASPGTSDRSEPIRLFDAGKAHRPKQAQPTQAGSGKVGLGFHLAGWLLGIAAFFGTFWLLKLLID